MRRRIHQTSDRDDERELMFSRVRTAASGSVPCTTPPEERTTKTTTPIDEKLREELLAAHAVHLKEDAAIFTEPPAWNRRFSWRGALCALLIWLFVAVVVRWRCSLTSPDGSHRIFDSNGRVTTAAALLKAKALELPAGCTTQYCDTESFGTILGAHNGVFAFSNCNHNTCIALQDSKISIPLPKNLRERLGIPEGSPDSISMTSGMKWQCVEYARRYWMLAGSPEPAYFGSVDGAADIWDLDSVSLLDGSTTPMLKYPNGLASSHGGSRPMVGDLIIYPRDSSRHLPYGHVAVVVGVEADMSKVYLAEQNWASTEWPGPFHNHSRTLPLTRTSGDGYWIEDELANITGWVRYAQHYDK